MAGIRAVVKRGKVTAIFIAYNAASTLEDFHANFPRDLVDDMVLIDDASRDGTYELARRLGIPCSQNQANLGYGGNLKRILAVALREGADILIDIHPDGEYKTTSIAAALARVDEGAEFVLGNRFTPETDPKNSGMFPWKRVFISALNRIDRWIMGVPVDDLHQGFRVYTRSMLEKVNFECNSNGYLFSFELIAQAVMSGVKMAQVPVETNYRGSKRGADLKHSIVYSLGTFRVLGKFLLARLGIPYEMFKRPHLAMESRVGALLIDR